MHVQRTLWLRMSTGSGGYMKHPLSYLPVHGRAYIYVRTLVLYMGGVFSVSIYVYTLVFIYGALVLFSSIVLCQHPLGKLTGLGPAV